MMDRRNRKIEEIMKHDPEYKPPADYRYGAGTVCVCGGGAQAAGGRSASRVLGMAVGA